MTMPPPPSQPPSGGPPHPVQPPSGFGPPGSGGFGPPAPGGWPPPPPPPGHNRGRAVAAIVAVAVVALALITASVIYLTGGDSDKSEAVDGKPSASQPPSPSEPETQDPTEIPNDGDATDFPEPGEGDEPSEEPDEGADDVPLPSFLLQEGDCYDRSEEREGAVETKDCDSPHDAEVVSRKKITGDYGTDSAVRQKADSLCRSSLRDKAAEQPSGTVGGTLISYPKAENVGNGFDYVTCSLTAGKDQKLDKPLV
ncbi:hypothetical protein MMF93_30645 [Streptomyces tubbatahanensis]|uniref:Septum formation-related domain-containing protein n=1 Tax=Streptomyces tubbatahanensis TaxID=2923272 RepID=A0ABY3Y0I0_9ACTN|nr:hypothetical protein [Streptomyces tubbatahanensis]UNT00337.1 hypothetical protein MMF93_30645 [Streptomyces tubbatahanensis]